MVREPKEEGEEAGLIMHLGIFSSLFFLGLFSRHAVSRPTALQKEGPRSRRRGVVQKEEKP